MKTVKQAADSLLERGEITKEEYSSLEESGLMEKDAGFLGNLAKGVGSNFEKIKGIGILAGLAGAAGLGSKELIYDPIATRSKTKKSFNLMSKKVPQLAEKDPEDIKDYFNVVKTFSPKAASNPLVAGALVNKMMEFGGVDHKLVQDIAAIEAGLQTPSVVQTAAESAAKSVSAFPKMEDDK